MTGETVLIAAFSGRALAESARRAGYVPLVVDAFGDADTRAAAHAYAQIPNAVRRGFSTKPLFAALDAVIESAPSAPVGIVLGSGFEDRPMLIDSLDRRHRLLGTKGDTVREFKDPKRFFPLLKQLGIAHPETRFDPPGDAGGWIAKRAGAAGGAHIRDLDRLTRTRRSHYFQRRLTGTPMSILAMATRHGCALELSRQWTAPSAHRPYRYGGAVLVDYDEDSRVHAKMVEVAAMFIELLDPVGLLSFDFIVSGDIPYLLEVNPRPGATLDIFDDLNGILFRIQVEAAFGNPLPMGEHALSSAKSRASALLYADHGALVAGDIAWPDWVSDRPLPGTHIPPESPVATVRADGSSAEEAEALVRERLSQLSRLVYTQSKDLRLEETCR